jgi:FKBP-type peptidyl-prolyl cis-trans isomerase
MIPSSLLLTCFSLLVASRAAFAFAPPTISTTKSLLQTSHPRQTAPSLLYMALEEVDPNDPFENYKQSKEQTDVAIKDTVEGTGDVVQGEGQLLTVAYKGRFMESGKQFDQSENFVCRIGKGTVLPGFEKGLMVRARLERIDC